MVSFVNRKNFSTSQTIVWMDAEKLKKQRARERMTKYNEMKAKMLNKNI